MATVIHTPSAESSERIVERTDSTGWAIAVVVLLAIVAVAAFMWTRMNGLGPAAPTSGANSNITLPTPVTNDGAGGAASGAGGPQTSGSQATPQ